jgi:hypothetical protein
MDSNILNNAINRAAMLMNNERFNSIVESKARGGAGKGGNEFSHFEAQAFGGHTPQTQNTPVQQPVMQPTPSVLPTAIRESFSLSNTQVPVQQPSYITEAQTPVVQQTIPQSSSINYEIIKALIDESISRHLNEIKQSLLNESANSLSGIKISDGNKIVLMDKSKNIYDATLKKRNK